MYNDLLINGKAYALYTVSIAVLLYLILWLAMYTSYHFRLNDYIGFVVMLSIVLGIMIGNVFPDFNNSVKAANYLLLPASTLEKFLSQFLIRVVLTTALFAAIFQLDAHLAICSISQYGRELHEEKLIEAFSYSELFSQVGATREKLFLWLSIFSLMAFLFSVRLFFKKYAIVKTLFTGIMLIAGFTLVFLLYSLIYYMFSPEEIPWVTTLYLRRYEICENLYTDQLYFYCIGYISWIFFLITGYYKLKEKQI
jgi:hypothetical protein